MPYTANEKRYDRMQYKRCGKSGIKLPRICLGMWHNFGSINSFENGRDMIRCAFDSGITHFDLANNYGPVYGSAETTFGEIMEKDMRPYRDEMIISTKAGYDMWPGPYGDFGSKKYLTASLDQSLKRMKLDYVDIFYHHRPDPETPLEETMDALAGIVRQGKALYVGISNYPAELADQAFTMLESMGIHCLIHQPSYSMLNRWVEDGLLDVLNKHSVGAIAFSPLSQGILTDRYLNGIPKDSRAGGTSVFLSEKNITPELLEKIKALNGIAAERGQSLAQMALAWVLRKPEITSVLVGASRPSQILDSVKTVENMDFSESELLNIEGILNNNE